MVEVAIGSAVAISKVVISNGHCISPKALAFNSQEKVEFSKIPIQKH